MYTLLNWNEEDLTFIAQAGMYNNFIIKNIGGISLQHTGAERNLNVPAVIIAFLMFKFVLEFAFRNTSMPSGDPNLCFVCIMCRAQLASTAKQGRKQRCNFTGPP